MGKSKKQVTKNSKESKELPGVKIVLDPIIIDEDVALIPMFSELSYLLCKYRMEAYLKTQ